MFSTGVKLVSFVLVCVCREKACLFNLHSFYEEPVSCEMITVVI